MGEINIQPKKRQAWPWLLGIIAVFIIIWIIVKALNAQDGTSVEAELRPVFLAIVKQINTLC